MAGKMGQTHAGGLTKKVATMRAKGKSMRDISLAVGRCRDTVGRILKTEEAKEILSKCHAAIVEKAPKAVENILVAVEDFQDAYASGNKVQAGIGWEATKLVTAIPGLSPAAQTSVVHQTFIHNETNVIDPMIAELIKKHLGDVIDITPSEVACITG